MGCASSVNQTSNTVVGNQEPQFGGSLTFAPSTHKVAQPEQDTSNQITVVPFSRPAEPEPQPQIQVQPVQQKPQAQEAWVFQPTPGQPDVAIPPSETELFRNQEVGVMFQIGEISQVLKSVVLSVDAMKKNIPEAEAKIKKENRYLKGITIRFDMDETENVDYFITDVFKTAAYTQFNLALENLSTVSEKAVQVLGEALARHGLEKLTLMHCYIDATDKFFESVLSGLKKNNKSMTYFKLDFIECPEVTDESFRHIKEAVESNQALEHFGVYFGKSAKITEKSVAYVKEALKNKPNIKRLELGFQYMKQITDTSLPIFLEIIKSFPQLTYIDFSMPDAGFTDAGFASFETSLNALNIQNTNITWKVPSYF